MILGIDLGTTNSLAAVFRKGEVELIPNAFGEYLTPSVVGLDESDQIVIGKVAKERLVTQPDLTVAKFKQFMGTDKLFYLGEKAYKPEELSSFIIRKLVEDAETYLEQKVEEVVVSVPAYFNDAQRYATKLAAQLAGVPIERIINEPSAAALAQHLQSSEEEATYIVVDFGGGTLDISVVEAFDNVVEILAIAGDNRLGGEDFTAALAQYFLEKQGLNTAAVPKGLLHKTLLEAERVKCQLNDCEEVEMKVLDGEQVYRDIISYQAFYKLSQDLLKRLKNVLDRALFDARYQQVSAKNFVLVGGTSKLRLVREFLAYCIQQPLAQLSNPDTIIAKGCGLVAGIKERKEQVRDIMLSDICPFSLGIAVNEDDFEPIIERNTALPASKTKEFIPSELGQTKVLIRMYQGEQMQASKNYKLGQLEVEIPENFKERERFDVCFTYDLNGILDVDLLIHSNQKSYSKTILKDQVQLGPEELKAKQEELNKLKVRAQDTEIYHFLIEKANRLYGLFTGREREALSYTTKAFQEDIEHLSIHKRPRAYKEFSDFLERLEQGY